MIRKVPPVLLNSYQWLQIYIRLHPGLIVCDPDGWDRRADYWEESWTEDIDQDEFESRLMASTCRLPNTLLKVWGPGATEHTEGK